ncbi:MAG: hypothetical protein CHACPFDD_00092 [Phycisphaerae bacterium]|nr:hypothetical protein [Phycisphaerae bacterium]
MSPRIVRALALACLALSALAGDPQPATDAADFSPYVWVEQVKGRSLVLPRGDFLDDDTGFDREVYSSELFPYYGYPITPTEVEYATSLNEHVVLRPFVANCWVFWPQQIAEFLPWYRKRVEGAHLGRYFASIIATPADSPTSIGSKLPNVPDAWLLRRADGGYFTIDFGLGEPSKIIDLTIPAARTALIDFWIERSRSWDFVFIDSVIYNYTDLFKSCSHGEVVWFAAVRRLLEDANARMTLPIIANVACRPEEAWPDLYDGVDGFHFEFALSGIYYDSTAKRVANIRDELAAFRDALDRGKTVLLSNNNEWAAVGDDYQRSLPPTLGPLLSAAVCLLKNPGDPILYNCNTNLNRDYSPYPFHDWWRDLGRPLAPCYWDGFAVRRDFENGSIELDIHTPQPIVRLYWSAS